MVRLKSLENNYGNHSLINNEVIHLISEVAFDAKGAITMMAVDNLPCELPKDASDGFGDLFLTHVIPAFFNGDKDGILARAAMTNEQQLTPRYEYLQGYVNGEE